MTELSSEDKPISETVTVSFIANVEVDPEEFDLRVKKPDKIREELFKAAMPGCSLQQVCGNSEEGLERHRRRIKEARNS
jgi:hypothetical protein